MVDRPDLGKYQPSCILAHELVNRLSVIVGYCDLLADEAPEDTKCLKRLNAIRCIAKTMADDLTKHQCQLGILARESLRAPEEMPAILHPPKRAQSVR
jgi:hypothetical protein